MALAAAASSAPTCSRLSSMLNLRGGILPRVVGAGSACSSARASGSSSPPLDAAAAASALTPGLRPSSTALGAAGVMATAAALAAAGT